MSKYLKNKKFHNIKKAEKSTLKKPEKPISKYKAAKKKVEFKKKNSNKKLEKLKSKYLKEKEASQSKIESFSNCRGDNETNDITIPEVFTDKERQEIMHQAEKGIAQHQFNRGKIIKLENKGIYNKEICLWYLRSGLNGCSRAIVTIIDEIPDIIHALLGYNNDFLNPTSDMFINYSLGYFLYNYKSLKVRKKYEDWLEHEEDLEKKKFYEEEIKKNFCDEPDLPVGKTHLTSVNKNLLFTFNKQDEKIEKNKKEKDNEKVLSFRPYDISSYEELGFKLLKMSSEKGCILAKIELLRKKLYNSPTEKDYLDYLKLLKDGSKNGINRAQFLLAEEVLFSENDYRKFNDENKDEAFNYLETSAHSGYYLSQYKLNTIFKEGLCDCAVNNKEAFIWCNKAAEHGYAEAEYTLSLYYKTGLGTKKCLNKSIEFMKKAEYSYHPNAAYNLGIFYRNGVGCTKDEKLAFKYIKKSFYDYRDLDGAYLLGFMSKTGDFIPKDEKKAFRLFEYGARYEHPSSLYMVAECYYNGIGVEQDYEWAFQYYKEAAFAKEPEAFCKLATCFILGRGIYKDYGRAIACLNHASDLDFSVVEKYIYTNNGENIKMFNQYLKDKKNSIKQKREINEK